jgi:REP element-mobilizing transposase RayT
VKKSEEVPAAHLQSRDREGALPHTVLWHLAEPRPLVSGPIHGPLAYLITFTAYGVRLHGDASGSVDRRHNVYGTPHLQPDPRRLKTDRGLMRQPPYMMDGRRRGIVLEAIRELCVYRGWTLLAAHVRSNHVHLVVNGDATPERVMTDAKSLASRNLNWDGCDSPDRRRWTRHGSTRYLWKTPDVEAAVEYVVREQGEPMAVFEL